MCADFHESAQQNTCLINYILALSALQTAPFRQSAHLRAGENSFLESTLAAARQTPDLLISRD